MYIELQEIFSSIQGEGMRVGEPSTFIRFTGCNLKCINCDTKYSWKTVGTSMTVEYILKEIDEKHCTKSFVITGGEPLLQQEGLKLLVYALKERFPFCNITVETNGSIKIVEDLPVFWSFSPKMENTNTQTDLYSYIEAVKHNIGITKDRQVKFLVEVFRGSSSLRKLYSDIKKLPLDNLDVVVQPLMEIGSDTKVEQIAKMHSLYTSIISNIKSWDDVKCRSIRFIGQLHKVFTIE